MEQSQFALRIAKLRTQKGVSARDMSLSLGQSECYINKIESGANYPSMTVFFYICDYFQISPQEFFDTGIPDPCKMNEAVKLLSDLTDEQLKAVISLIGSFKKR